MKHNFPKLQIAILLVIGITLLAVPLTRRYAALQLGLIPNGAPQLVATVVTHSRANDPLENDSWNKLLDAVQRNEDPNYADAYILQHPEQITLLTERARYLIGNSRLPQRAVELDYIPPGAPLNDEFAEQEKEREAKSKVLLQRVRELCLLGRKQEPQNSYYDLLLSIVAYSQYRDNDGWNFLQSAIVKPHFDPHYLSLQTAQIRNNERILRRPLLWEEKFNISSGIQFRELHSIRTWGRWMEWKAITEIRAGKMPAAMTTLKSLSRMGSKITAEARYRIVAQIGNALLAMAYYAPLREQQPPPSQPKYDANGMPLTPPPPPSLSSSPRLTQEQRYFKVQEYARNHNLPQLQEIGQDYLRGRRYLTNMLDIDAPVTYYDMTIPQMVAMSLSWVFGVWCFFLVAAAFIFWLMTSFFKRPDVLPSRFSLRLTTMLTIIAPVLLVGSFLYTMLNQEPWRFSWSAIFPPVDYGLESWLIRFVAMLFPIIVALCVSAFLVLFTPWRQTLARLKRSSWRSRLKVLLGVLGFILAPLALNFFVSNWPYLYDEVLHFPIDFYLVYFANSLELNSALQSWEEVIVLLVLGAIYFWLLWRFARSQRPSYKKGQLIYLMRRGLLSLAFCSVIFYGICMVSTVITRKNADRKMEPFLKYGDLRVYGNKADLSGPVDPHRLFQKIEEINKHRVIRL